MPIAELSEAGATGETARIFAALRRLCAVPYVSAMQRHLATRPGWLEWVWGAVAPAFESGRAQETAWRLAGDIDLAPLPPIARPALRAWGVDHEAEAAVAAICDNFVRVAPQNMVFAGLLRRLLQGERPAGAGLAADWAPPAPLPAMPKPPPDLSPEVNQLLQAFAVDAGAGPFVATPYRLLANWPGLLAHLATVLGPRLAAPATQAACRALAQRIDTAVPAILADLPPLAAEPPAEGRNEVLAVLQTYGVTSPQLIVFFGLIRRALPS